MKPKVLFTDGEGPIVFKDLAADVTEKVVPGLFPVLSFYDDYLAEIGTEGYQAGDTLALVVPHFLAHGVKDKDIANEAKDAKLCFGVEEYVSELKKDEWNIRIISTAYSQMWELVGEHLGIPIQDIACTKLDLKALKESFGSKDFYARVLAAEKNILASTPLANEAMREVDQGKSVVEVLGKNPKFTPLRESLDHFYWDELKNLGYQTLEAVTVIGGKRKIDAAQNFARELGLSLSDIPYVGDSITDDAIHKRLKDEGGLPIAINGNAYALRNDRVAVATEDMRNVRPILDAWQAGGFEAVKSRIDESNQSFMVGGKEGSPIHEEPSHYYHIVKWDNPANQRELRQVHGEFRRRVRGAATAKLG